MRAAIPILMSCALAFAPAGALAEEHADERSYDVTVSEDRAEITMAHEIEQRSGETSIVFDTREGLLQGGFGFAEADQADERLDLRLHQIVEFVDENDDGHLDEEDRVSSAWKLSNASENLTAESNGTVEWRALQEKNVTSDDDVEGTQVRGVAEFPEQDPIAGVISELGQGENRTFTVNVTVYDGPAEVEDSQVPSSHADVAWTVNNYPYTRDDTQLAIVTTANETGMAEDDELASRSTIEGFDVAVSAKVSEIAHVDGNETDVQRASLETDDETDRVVSLSYERGTVIEHGMLLGSEVSPATSTIDSATDQVSEVPGLGAAAALGIIGTLAVAVKRR